MLQNIVGHASGRSCCKNGRCYKARLVVVSHPLATLYLTDIRGDPHYNLARTGAAYSNGRHDLNGRYGSTPRKSRISW